MADLTLKERSIRRFEGLKAARQPYESDAKEIATYAAPARSRWLSSDTNKNKRQSNKRLNSSHGIIAFRTLQGGMTSGLSSGSRPWFTMTVYDHELAENVEVKAWLGEVERLTYAFIATTNFYSAVKTGYLELGSFGTEACVALEHPDEGMVCHQLTYGEYYIGLNSALTPGALYRHCSYTALQATQMFDRARLPSRVRDCYDAGRYDEVFNFIHAIEENDDFQEGVLGPRGKPWRSLYWLDGDNDKDSIIEQGGYSEQPFWAPRWDTTGGDIWGQGPGHDALTDLRELQMQSKRKAEAVDMHVWPEKIVSSKVKLKNQPKSIVHSADVDITKSVFVPYEIPYQTVGVIREDIEACKLAINEATYAELFMAITNMQGIQPRNIEEIAARNEEKMTQLGPVIERVNNEKLEVAIRRIFGIMSRGRMYPPAPEVMHGTQIKIEFVSVLTQLQRMVGLGNIERGLQFVGNLAGLYPQARLKLDPFEIVDEYFSRAGVPAKLVRSNKDAEADMEAEQQAASQEKNAAMAASLAKPAKDITDAARLASTAPDQSAVEALLPVLPR